MKTMLIVGLLWASAVTAQTVPSIPMTGRTLSGVPVVQKSDIEGVLGGKLDAAPIGVRSVGGPVIGYVPWPFGFEDNSVGGAFHVGPTNGRAGVTGGMVDNSGTDTSVAGIAAYGGVDSVALYSNATGPSLTGTITGVTFTATTAVLPTALDAQPQTLKIGAFVRSSGGHQGVVRSISTDRRTITVWGWAVPGSHNATPGQVPSAGSLLLNPIDSMFAVNFVAQLGDGSFANFATAGEFDAVNNKNNSANVSGPSAFCAGVYVCSTGFTIFGKPPTQASGFSTGILMSDLGANAMQVGRGDRGAVWIQSGLDGSMAIGAQGSGFLSSPSITLFSTGSSSPQGRIRVSGGTAGQDFSALMEVNAGIVQVQSAAIRLKSANVAVEAPTAQLSLGIDTQASLPHLNFLSGDGGQVDAQIRASGGGSSAGYTGVLDLYAATTTIQGSARIMVCPTSASGLTQGSLWCNGNVVTRVP